jgi:hypothetical protein
MEMRDWFDGKMHGKERKPGPLEMCMRESGCMTNCMEKELYLG